MGVVAVSLGGLPGASPGCRLAHPGRGICFRRQLNLRYPLRGFAFRDRLTVIDLPAGDSAV